MGMDVYGDNPTSDKGEYFRNNVWWWRPLWDYCLELHGDIADKVQHGHSNDGDGLDAYHASLLGERLLRDVATGVTDEYQKRYNQYLSELERSDCDLCEGTGIRTDRVGVEMGMPTKELDEDVAIIVGRTHGYCNACRGEGKVNDWETEYPFSVDNVRQFGEFLVDSGGFKIW